MAIYFEHTNFECHIMAITSTVDNQFDKSLGDNFDCEPPGVDFTELCLPFKNMPVHSIWQKKLPFNFTNFL